MTKHIKIIGDISWENYKAFTTQLKDLEDKSNKDEEIVIELSSDGGDAHVALAFAARIRLSPFNITIMAMGNVASAAVLVLASGDKRIMSKECWAMVHEDSAELSGTVVDLERESAQLRKMETQWCSLLAEKTHTKADVWNKMHKKTTYLQANECLKLGLIDGVI